VSVDPPGRGLGFGSTHSGAAVPLPWPQSKRALAAAAFATLDQACNAGGDTLVSLSLVHAAAMIVAELNERMAPIRDWIPPVPPPLGNLPSMPEPKA
jgi:hypothetical protein